MKRKERERKGEGSGCPRKLDKGRDSDTSAHTSPVHTSAMPSTPFPSKSNPIRFRRQTAFGFFLGPTMSRQIARLTRNPTIAERELGSPTGCCPDARGMENVEKRIERARRWRGKRRKRKEESRTEPLTFEGGKDHKGEGWKKGSWEWWRRASKEGKGERKFRHWARLGGADFAAKAETVGQTRAQQRGGEGQEP